MHWDVEHGHTMWALGTRAHSSFNTFDTSMQYKHHCHQLTTYGVQLVDLWPCMLPLYAASLRHPPRSEQAIDPRDLNASRFGPAMFDHDPTIARINVTPPAYCQPQP